MRFCYFLLIIFLCAGCASKPEFYRLNSTSINNVKLKKTNFAEEVFLVYFKSYKLEEKSAPFELDGDIRSLVLAGDFKISQKELRGELYFYLHSWQPNKKISSKGSLIGTHYIKLTIAMVGSERIELNKFVFKPKEPNKCGLNVVVSLEPVAWWPIDVDGWQYGETDILLNLDDAFSIYPDQGKRVFYFPRSIRVGRLIVKRMID